MNAAPIQPNPGERPVTEPDPKRPTVPVWLLILMLLLLYWGMLYFDQHGGWLFSQEVYSPYHNTDEIAGWQPPVPEGGSPSGFIVYNRPTCVACHQKDGKGTPGQFPPLIKSEWVNEPEPGRLIRIVLNGLNGPLEFQGQNFNGTMVPWKESLTDQEIADVLTYIRQNKEWGNNAPEVKAERVKQVRDKIKERSLSFTPEELLKINPAE